MSIATADGAFEFANTRRGLFAQRSNLLRPRFWRLIARPASLQPRGPAARRPRRTRRRSASSCATPATRGGSSSGRSCPRSRPSGRPTRDALWEFPLGFLAEFLENHGQLQLAGRPAMADDRRRLARLRRATDRRRFDGRIRAGSGGAPDRARSATGVGDRRPTAVRPSVFDRGRDRRATPTRRWRCSPRPTAAEREVLGAMRYQPNEARPAHRRLADAAAAPRLGELELPPHRRAGRRAPRSPTG